MEVKTFKHSGDLGDIIYSLPTIRALGGGILYLDPNGGGNNEFIQRQIPERKTKLNKLSIESLTPILLEQPYINDVRLWSDEPVDYDLDKFRQVYSSPNRRDKNSNLVDLHLQAFDLPHYSTIDIPWITVSGESKLHKPYVIARSPRVQGGYGRLNAMKYVLEDKAIFVGLPKEHEYFEWTFGVKIDYVKTKTIKELATVIKASEIFFGNSSFPLSLAIGMGHKKIVQEWDPKVPVTMFQNMPTMEYL
jgi:hypothetical protein